MTAPASQVASTADSHRTVLVAPSYNHAPALAAFLPSLDACDLPCIAIDDGSTDQTSAVLAAWRDQQPSRRWLITHDRNRGKAAALLAAFELACEKGFKYALTIDTDGQHDARDIAGLLAASRHEPHLLIIGARSVRTRGYPLRSRVGRAISNALVWLASGQRVQDSQSGMRVYPLDTLACVTPPRGWAPRYGFETEVLTRLGLQGVGCRETPIRCIYQSRDTARSHFRVFADSWRAITMHARLLAAAHAWGHPAHQHGDTLLGTIPRRLLWWFAPMRIVRMARGDERERRAFAASVAWGAFMAIAPLYGVKTVVCLWLSRRFALHPLVVIAVSSISSPPMGFVIVAASIMLGHMLLERTGPDAEHWSTLLTTIRSDIGSLPTRVQGLFVEWLVGGFIAAIIVGLLTYVISRVALRSSRRQALTSATPPCPPT
ncbi:MAG: DUF2062 domain-containing protein [Phycisphaerae bacterium]